MPAFVEGLIEQLYKFFTSLTCVITPSFDILEIDGENRYTVNSDNSVY